jgi:hypothetical protein
MLSKRWSAARINSRLNCKLEVNCCNQAISLKAPFRVNERYDSITMSAPRPE